MTSFGLLRVLEDAMNQRSDRAVRTSLRRLHLNANTVNDHFGTSMPLRVGASIPLLYAASIDAL